MRHGHSYVRQTNAMSGKMNLDTYDGWLGEVRCVASMLLPVVGNSEAFGYLS